MAAAVAVAEQEVVAQGSPQAATEYASVSGTGAAAGQFRPEGSVQSEWVMRHDEQGFAHPSAASPGAPELDASVRASMNSPSVVNRVIPGAPLHCYGPGERVTLPPPEPAAVVNPKVGLVTQVIESEWSEWTEGAAEFNNDGWGEWTAVPAGISGDIFVGTSAPEWKQGKPSGNYGFASDSDGWVVHGYSGSVTDLPAPLAHELTVSPPFWGPGPPPAGY